MSSEGAPAGLFSSREESASFNVPRNQIKALRKHINAKYAARRHLRKRVSFSRQQKCGHILLERLDNGEKELLYVEREERESETRAKCA